MIIDEVHVNLHESVVNTKPYNKKKKVCIPGVDCFDLDLILIYNNTHHILVLKNYFLSLIIDFVYEQKSGSPLVRPLLICVHLKPGSTKATATTLRRRRRHTNKIRRRRRRYGDGDDATATAMTLRRRR
jgi:hypothetical protein